MKKTALAKDFDVIKNLESCVLRRVRNLFEKILERKFGHHIPEVNCNMTGRDLGIHFR